MAASFPLICFLAITRITGLIIGLGPLILSFDCAIRKKNPRFWI